MKTIMNAFMKAMVVSLLVLPMMTSCFDDSLLWDSINKIEHRLDSLENSLNQQFQALNTLIDSKTTIAACEKNSDGSYDVTLSNGMKFTVLPDGTDFSALVSIVEVGGVRCWATYDANGNLVALKDPSGNPVPVVKDEYRAKVEVLVEDGKYYLVIDGNKYMTGYDTKDMVQVFSSCTPLKDASGNVYAMRFTFGEGMNVTVAMDGYTGVIFRLPNAVGESKILTEYFITYADKQSILLDMEGVVDYVMQIPDGWRVAERTDIYSEEVYLDITAPSKELVASGAAAAKGELKVMSLVEGGKAAVSKLTLSAEPFKLFDISGAKAVIEPYTGVQKYVYGISLLNDFNEKSVLETVTSLITTNMDIPVGYGIAENGININHSDLYGKDLDTEKAYVFWAIPALYKEGDNGGFFVKSGTFSKYTLSPVTATVTCSKVNLLDAEINATILGTEQYYAGTALMSDDLFDNIIYQINNGILSPVSTPMSYKGPASAFPSVEVNESIEFLPATTYVTWIVPIEEEKAEYSKNDISHVEFTTLSITSGGNSTITCETPVTGITDITIPASSEGAVLFYYTWFDKKKGDWNSSLGNDDKVKVIMSDAGCTVVKVPQETKAAAQTVNLTLSKAKPNTEMWLYAVAVDAEGKYGEVKIEKATTKPIEYNSLVLSTTVLDLGADKVSMKINVTGGTATEFIYWFGKEIDGFWANSSYLGATKESATEYMASYPEDDNIRSAMKKYGSIASDGTFTATGLNVSTNYVLMVLAKNDEGKWSAGAYKMITTLAADLGTVVREGSAEWNQAKSQIKIDWKKEKFAKGEGSFGFASYAYNFECPKNLTAFVLSASLDFYNTGEFLTKEDIIIDVETRAGKYVEKGGTPIYYDEKGKIQLVSRPDYYNDNGELQPGTLLSIYQFYVHGYPAEGYVTYFAEGSHGKDNCIAWENGECSKLAHATKQINNLRSMDYWSDYFRNTFNMTNEEYIRKNAEAYYTAHYAYYKDSEPMLYENKGGALEISNPYGIGPNDEGDVNDAVIVVLKDLQGNYYEPMYFQVPDYFTK